VPDTTIKPAPAEVELRTDGTITATLSLLDQEPFRFLAKAGRPVTLADGRVRLDGRMAFPLKKGRTPDEYDVVVDGTITDLRSDVLVPGRRLSAQQVEMRLADNLLSFEGGAQIGAVPVGGRFETQLGPKGDGSARIDGWVELSERFIDEFRIGVPPGSLQGQGRARIALDLQKGQPPDFRLSTDFAGVGLRIAALDWSLPRAARGQLTVEGAFGKPARIDRLAIDAPGLTAAGSLTLSESGGMAAARFDRVQVGGWFDGPVTLTGRGKGRSPAVAVTGGTVDMRRAKLGGGGGQGGPVTLALDRLQISDTIALEGFRGRFDTGGGMNGTFTANVNGRAAISGTVVPRNGRSALRVTSADAGGVLAATGLLKQAREGGARPHAPACRTGRHLRRHAPRLGPAHPRGAGHGRAAQRDLGRGPRRTARRAGDRLQRRRREVPPDPAAGHRHAVQRGRRLPRDLDGRGLRCPAQADGHAGGRLARLHAERHRLAADPQGRGALRLQLHPARALRRAAGLGEPAVAVDTRHVPRDFPPPAPEDQPGADAVKLSDFDFDLPERLIATRPARPRSSARLLVAEGDTFTDAIVRDLADWLRPGDRLVLNDTAVIPARLSGLRHRQGAEGKTAARMEVTLLEPRADGTWASLLKPLKKIREGEEIVFSDRLTATLTAREEGQARLAFNLTGADFDAALAEAGEMPLPPYIAAKRAADAQDREDYQTVWAERPGAVAAPTASLHFDDDLLARIAARGVATTRVTLHVGAGTFLPVKVEDVTTHRMHAEWGEVTEAAAAEIAATRAAGGRIIPVGTTALRLIESAARSGTIGPWRGETDIFIYPGFTFHVTDALMTNFHLPRSTLLMLVSALMGQERMKRVYAHAVAGDYRFFSYGDASLLIPG
jgi:S-adenosylmethionine:tRNA ribosyltransferase-isomerase